jgi:hypothetical protein
MTRSSGPTIVGELMAVDPIVIGANLPLDEAADILDRHGISGAPVVDAAGSLVGVLSQTDLIRARSTEYLWANWPGLAVRHLDHAGGDGGTVDPDRDRRGQDGTQSNPPFGGRGRR